MEVLESTRDLMAAGWRRSVLAILVAPIFSMLVWSEASASIVLDQESMNPPTPGWIIFYGEQRMAQTFTAGLTGQLAHIDVLAGADGGHPATVTLVETVGGLPTGTALGTVDIASWTPNSWNTADFLAESVWLTSGAQYGIVLSTTGREWNSIQVNWGLDQYVGGQNYADFSTGGEKWSDYGRDISFRTWMAVDAVPAPGAILLAGLGAGAVGLLRRRQVL